MNQISQILEQLPVFWSSNTVFGEQYITGIQYDSRKVEADNLFVALVGGNVDGHVFIPSAVEKGAAAVIGSQPLTEYKDLSIPYIQVDDTREALAYICAAFYDFPARQMSIIGVTGTDGKTTTANLVYQVLKTAGFRTGVISTVNAQIGDDVLDTGFHVTTPEATAVQYYLSKMRDAGMTHVVLETTSHGLAQHRVTGCEFDIGVVTNITHEHLDYHGSYQEYRASKAKLFKMLSTTGNKPTGNIRLSVLNQEDESYTYLQKVASEFQISYGLSDAADIWAKQVEIMPEGISFTACSRDFEVQVECSLSGEFNVLNALAAMAVGIYGYNIRPDIAAEGVSNLPGIPGRMEVIDLGQPFTAIVDFAHTPNALKRALTSARQMNRNRIIAIFGSAGLRDRLKRRMMAAVSAQLADITILTAEDPRTESLEDILKEMRIAAEENGAVLDHNLFTVKDRGEAIKLGVSLAKTGDLVMACGKGHEQSMCFGEIEYAWDDRTAMRAALSELMDMQGPEMPYLPTQE